MIESTSYLDVWKTQMTFQWNAILQIDSRTLNECVMMQGVPLIDAVQVAIYEDPGAPTGVAESIYREMQTRFQDLNASGKVTTKTCRGPRMLQCQGRGEPDCRCTLVVVTGKRTVDNAVRQQMLQWPRGGVSEDLIIPVLPHGSNVNTVLPNPLDDRNVVFHHGPVDQTVNQILQPILFGDTKRRVFISYRRNDTQQLADQLFDSLSQAGFNVFLDRFSGTPGRLFPEELCEEIIDKGLILLLESPGIRNSPWTLAELGFAYLHQIGRIAINVNRSTPLSLIDPRDRHRVSLQTNKTLSASDLQKTTDFIKTNYARQALWRRVYLEVLLRMGLASHGIIPTAVGGGAFRVNGGKGQSYIVGLAERAPSLRDVRRVRQKVTGKDRPAVLGSHAFLPAQYRRDLDWLARTASADLISEYVVPSTANSIAKGKVPL